VSLPTPQNPDVVPQRFDEIAILEIDENVPPRPEEEIADVARSVPDAHGPRNVPTSGL